MNMAYSLRIGALGLALVVVACGRSPTSPSTSNTASAPVAAKTTFTIVDGWSREPVAGAAVTANGGETLTDASGQVQLATPSDCLTITVRAVGFLERRTCGSAAARQITLWPVANADESEATRKWIFTNDRIGAERWAAPIDIALAPELAAQAGVADIWNAATDAVSQLSQGRIHFHWVTSAPEEGLLIVGVALPLSCSLTPPWPVEIGGFCVKYDPDVYYLDRLQVPPDRLTDRGTAVRALLSAVGIRPHSLPGLMNMTRPASDVSEFERKTLGMLGLRPRTVTWPDYDQSQ